MNPPPRTPAHSSTPLFDFDARFLTAIIPVRWRAAVLVLGTVTLFPLIITLMMFDAVTHDMPGLRAPFKRVFGIMSSWFRMPRVSPASEPMAFPGLADAR
jgi:hypothetical protein